MIAAEVRLAVPGAGGLLSDSNEHAGFSFQISETPPPARAQSGTPLADLVLDMDDFGEVAAPSPAPPREVVKPQSAWLEEPAVTSPTMVKEMRPEKEGRPENDAPPRRGAPVEPLCASESSVPAAQAVLSDAVVAASPKNQQKTEPSSPRHISEAPRIKKISFPAQLPKAPAPDRAQDDPRAPSRTKFSRSISSQHPRPSLDSEPEAEAEEVRPVSASEKSGEMALPEDLPSGDQEFLPEDGPPSWGSDTPSAREIWKKARTSWHIASKQAAALGGQGIRRSKALAGALQETVRERLREASEERAFRAQLTAERSGAPAGETFVKSDLPAAPSSPSMAGRAILGLARASGRKVAAPASALAAAAIVYFAGSHLLGTSSAPSLSKSASEPEIPELGTLDNNREQAKDEKSAVVRHSPGEETPKSEKASASGPPPMETEVTEMPKGMSWPGKGLIEVVTSQDELVYVDGVFTGRGPLRRIPVSPGEHEVSIRADGKERKGSVKVVADKNTRAVFKSE